MNLLILTGRVGRYTIASCGWARQSGRGNGTTSGRCRPGGRQGQVREHSAALRLRGGAYRGGSTSPQGKEYT